MVYVDITQRRQWHPTPVLLPGKSHGWRSLVGCSPWGREESDTTERPNFHFSLSLFTFLHWRRKWQPTPLFLPGESHGRGSLVGCRLWGCTESDTTGVTQQQQQQAKLILLLRKITPHDQTFAILMYLKHGDSLLLNQEIKNKQTTAKNQRVRAMGDSRQPLGFSWLPDGPYFYLMG